MTSAFQNLRQQIKESRLASVPQDIVDTFQIVLFKTKRLTQDVTEFLENDCKAAIAWTAAAALLLSASGSATQMLQNYGDGPAGNAIAAASIITLTVGALAGIGAGNEICRAKDAYLSQSRIRNEARLYDLIEIAKLTRPEKMEALIKKSQKEFGGHCLFQVAAFQGLLDDIPDRVLKALPATNRYPENEEGIKRFGKGHTHPIFYTQFITEPTAAAKVLERLLKFTTLLPADIAELTAKITAPLPLQVLKKGIQRQAARKALQQQNQESDLTLA